MANKSRLKKWISEYLPEDLLKAINGDIDDPTNKGRKDSIDEDNVNDFVFHGRQKKLFWKKIGFDQVIKDSGDKVSPIMYAQKKNAYKCCSYMYIVNDQLFQTQEIFKNHPYWYRLLLFSLERLQLIYDQKNFDDHIYDLLFNCPKKDGLFHVGGFLKQVQYFFNNLSNNDKFFFKKRFYKFKRSQFDEQKDIEFYNNLSGNDKQLLKDLVYKDHIFNLQLDKCIIEEGDLNSIFYCFRPYQFCEYIIKTEKFDEFNTWIKDHRKEIKAEACCHTIMPQFRQIYPIIYEGLKFDLNSLSDDDNIFVTRHLNKLIANKFVREVKFFLEKEVKLDKFIAKEILKTCDPEMMQIFTRKDKDIVQEAFDYLFGFNEACIPYLMKNGFYPSEKGIENAYMKHNENAKSLDLIELLPSDTDLDFLKPAIALKHFDLIDEFISKYGHRLITTDLDTWGLTKKKANYQKLCQKLGVEYVESESSSSDYRRKPERSSSNACRCSEKKEKVKLTPFLCCNRCSNNRLCAKCHKVSVPLYAVHVCSDHKPKGRVCPICNENRTPLSPSRLCEKCYQKYHYSCFVCGKK